MCIYDIDTSCVIILHVYIANLATRRQVWHNGAPLEADPQNHRNFIGISSGFHGNITGNQTENHRKAQFYRERCWLKQGPNFNFPFSSNELFLKHWIFHEPDFRSKLELMWYRVVPSMSWTTTGDDWIPSHKNGQLEWGSQRKLDFPAGFDLLGMFLVHFSPWWLVRVKLGSRCKDEGIIRSQ